MAGGPLHPGLAEPRTKEEWRHYLTAVPPTRPEPLTPAGYQKLAEEARDDFDDARHAWHSALVLIRTPEMKHIHNEIKIKLLANAHQPAGARRGVVIDGPPTIGKSTLVKLFAEYERLNAVHSRRSAGHGRAL